MGLASHKSQSIVRRYVESFEGTVSCSRAGVLGIKFTTYTGVTSERGNAVPVHNKHRLAHRPFPLRTNTSGAQRGGHHPVSDWFVARTRGCRLINGGVHELSFFDISQRNFPPLSPSPVALSLLRVAKNLIAFGLHDCTFLERLCVPCASTEAKLLVIVSEEIYAKRGLVLPRSVPRVL